MTGAIEKAAEQHLREITECPICMSVFTDPRVLPCIHTFCVECLNRTGEAEQRKSGEKMPCPLCRKEFIIPEDGMNGLQKNFFMENFLEFKTALQMGTSTIICDMCKIKNESETVKAPKATLRCMECQDHYCEDCAKIHQFQEATKDHQMVDIGSDIKSETKLLVSMKLCTKHVGKALDYYCSECKKIVCVSCFVESHKLHDCKDVTTVDKEFREAIQKNATKISAYANQIQLLRNNNEKRKSDFLKDIAEKENEIHKRNQEIKDMIDRHTKSLLDELSLIKSKLLKDMEIGMEEIDRCCTILESFEAYCTELTSKGSASDICSSVDELIARADDLERHHEAFISRPHKSVEVSFQATDLRDALQNTTNNFVGKVEGLVSSPRNPCFERSSIADVDEQCILCDACMADPDESTIQLPTASKRCLECEQNLCEQCLRVHLKQKLLRNHQIEDIWPTCQIEKNATKPSQSKADNIEENTSCKDLDSANFSSGCLSTTRAQYQSNAMDVMTQIIKERDRLKEYEMEMSRQVDQLLKVQDDINTKADDITKTIFNKYSECFTRLERDKNCLLEQLESRKKAIISENETKLEETISYLKKITDRRVNFEEILSKGSVDSNSESTKSLLLHVHFQQPIPSMENVSFHESSSWSGTDNILGRIDGLVNISKTQTEPILYSYRIFLLNANSLAKRAREIHWRTAIPNEIEMKNLSDLKTLRGVQNELKLREDDRKWDEIQAKHVRIVSLLNVVTRPTSEPSSEKLESHLTELQRNMGKLWNIIEFQIHYKNSEKGLLPEGFQNHGNTSYFNAVLQCLLQTVLLSFQLTVNLYGLENVLTAEKEIYHLSRAFMKLASTYNEPKQRQESLGTLYYKFTSSAQRFNDEGQHDSHDLLINFLDKLRVEERNAWKMPSDASDTQKMPTVVDQIFGGQFITVYTCHNCKEPYAMREPFLDISIPLCTLMPDGQKPVESKSRPKNTALFNFKIIDTPLRDSKSGETNLSSSSVIDNARKDHFINEVIKKMSQPIGVETLAEPETKGFWYWLTTSNLNVSQCLKYFTRAEVINDEYLCRNCQKPGSSQPTRTSATKRTLISSPPAVLVLHLNRFEQKSTGLVKRDEMISYDELLDLGPFCSSGALRIDPDEENVWYSLYAVVIHSDSFISRGHYFSYVKQRDSSAQLKDTLREKFLQENFGEWEKVPNDEDLAAIQKRNAIKKIQTAKRPIPIPGQWFYISDDTVRRCEAKEALTQKAVLLFYERIPGTDS